MRLNFASLVAVILAASAMARPMDAIAEEPEAQLREILPQEEYAPEDDMRTQIHDDDITERLADIDSDRLALSSSSSDSNKLTRHEKLMARFETIEDDMTHMHAMKNGAKMELLDKYLRLLKKSSPELVEQGYFDLSEPVLRQILKFLMLSGQDLWGLKYKSLYELSSSQQMDKMDRLGRLVGLADLGFGDSDDDHEPEPELDRRRRQWRQSRLDAIQDGISRERLRESAFDDEGPRESWDLVLPLESRRSSLEISD